MASKEDLRKEKEGLQEKLSSMSQVIEELSRAAQTPGAPKELEEKLGFEVKGLKDALDVLDKKIEKSAKKQEIPQLLRKEIEDALEPVNEQLAGLKKLGEMEQRVKDLEARMAARQIPQEITNLQKVLEGLTPSDVRRMQAFADNADMLIHTEVRSEVKRKFLEIFRDLKGVQNGMKKLAEDLEANVEKIDSFELKLEDVTKTKRKLENLEGKLMTLEGNIDKKVLEVYDRKGEKVIIDTVKELFPTYINPRFREVKEEIEKWATDVFYKTSKSIEFANVSIERLRKNMESGMKELAEMKKVSSMVSQAVKEANEYADYNDERLSEAHESMTEEKLAILRKETDRKVSSALASVSTAEIRVKEEGKVMHKRLDMAERETTRLKERVAGAEEGDEDASKALGSLREAGEELSERIDALEKSLEGGSTRLGKVSADILSIKSSMQEFRRFMREVAE